MRILQVMAGAPHGGAETAFVDMCIALSEAGHNITVATRSNPRNERLRKQGIPVHEMPFGGMLDILTKLRLRKLAGDVKPEIIQTWMSRAAQKVPRWTRAMRIPPYLVVSRLGGYYKLKHFRNTDYFTTITPDIKRFLVDQGVPADAVRHINNFAETEKAVKPASRKAADTPEGAPLLLALGRLHEAKGLDTLLQALARLPDIYLWIAGEGPQRAELENLAQTLGVDERVRFLGWRDDRAALLQAADICVFPSRYEPFGTVFVQAWAQKTPLVTSDADGPRQYVRDGEDGLVVPRDDAAALADAIKTLVDDPDLRQTIAENGYRRYGAEFTKDHTIQEYIAFYEDILARENIAMQQ